MDNYLSVSSSAVTVYTNTTANVTEIPEAYLTLEELNFLQFQFKLPAIIYTTILMLLGTPGNILVLYVYFLKWRKSTSRMFILFLTALDLVNCVTTLPMEIFVMRYSLMLDRPWLCKISRFSTYTMNSSSAAILVAIAVDRFKRICRPHGPQFSAKMSKYICIFCIFLALCLTWPSLLFYGTRVIDLGNVNGKACLLENQYDASVYPYIYFVVMMASTLVIFTTLSVLYYFVGLQVYRHRKNRLIRKAESAAAKSLVIQEQLSQQSNNDTLLQDSDSTEIKKALNAKTSGTGTAETKKVTKQRDQSTKQLLELEPLNTGCNGMSSSSCMTSSSCITSSCLTDVTTGSAESAEKKPEIKRTASVNGNKSNNRQQKMRKKTKTRFSKRKGTLKDSLTKSNGAHCIHMKLRIGRSTLMLFLITLAYIVSFLPFYVIAIIRQAYKEFVSELDNAGYMTYHVFLRSYLLSSAINPVIYSFCNAQFRTFCFGMFRRNRITRNDH